MTATIEDRVSSLEARMTVLEAGRPGRKKKPIIVKEQGKCGIDPTRDSSTCPDANVYRHQQGCRGDACVRENTVYYAQYRAKNKTTKEVEISE